MMYLVSILYEMFNLDDSTEKLKLPMILPIERMEGITE